MRSREFCNLPHKSPNVHSVYERYTLKYCTRVMCPCRAIYECVCFFFAGNVGSLKTQKSPENTKTKMSGRRRKKNRKRLGGAHYEHVCKSSGSTSQKRRGHWTLKEFGAVSLNQPAPGTIARSIITPLNCR